MNRRLISIDLSIEGAGMEAGFEMRDIKSLIDAYHLLLKTASRAFADARIKIELESLASKFEACRSRAKGKRVIYPTKIRKAAAHLIEDHSHRG